MEDEDFIDIPGTHKVLIERAAQLVRDPRCSITDAICIMEMIFNLGRTRGSVEAASRELDRIRQKPN